jgi:hypothetical protein
MEVEFFPGGSCRAARNGLYCVAATWALPSLFATVLVATHEAPMDAIVITLGGIPLAFCIMAVIAAIKCGAGKESGRRWAFLPVWVLAIWLPIGTLVSYVALKRLNEADLN